MSRIPPLDLESLNPEQRLVYDAIANGPRKGVRGPLAIWLHRPLLADRAQALGRYCRYDSSLPARLSELAIMLMGKYWMAEYEWAAHKPFALDAGIAPFILNAIRDGKKPAFQHEDEAIVYEFITQLHQQHQITEDLYARTVSMLGQDGVIDLVGIAGYYTFISMTIKVFQVPGPLGVEPELNKTLS